MHYMFYVKGKKKAFCGQTAPYLLHISKDWFDVTCSKCFNKLRARTISNSQKSAKAKEDKDGM